MQTLKGKNKILSMKEPNILFCGVYFLIQNDEIIYIGKAKNIYRRISSHKIKYDFFTIIQCKKEKLNELEKQYILKYKPIYNIHYLTKRGVIVIRMKRDLKNKVKEIAKKNGMILSDYVRFIMRNAIEKQQVV